MVISAKFPSRCRTCDGRIFAGDRVNWTRGVKGVSHVNCGPIAEPEREPEPEEIEEPETVSIPAPAPKPEPVKAVLSDPRKPEELCAFLTSLTREQLQALATIIAHEIERREPITQAA